MFEYTDDPKRGSGGPDAPHSVASKSGGPRPFGDRGLPSGSSERLGGRQASTAGKAWDEYEHMQFLEGLNAFGKGQWKQISKYYVPTRTPTQVASHAQKHFLRVTGNAKRKSKFAAVDAVAEVHFGPTVTRDGVSRGAGGGMAGVGVADISVAAAAAAAAEMAAAAPHGASRAPRSTKGRNTYESRGQVTSEDTGSTRPAFANGPTLFTTNGHMLSSKTVPPVQANGVALGIPLQEIPDLKAFGGKDLPMLKVIKGRIRATSSLFRPSSPAPSQRKLPEDVETFESDSGVRRGKRARKYSNLNEGGFDSALAALANIAAGLADGHVY
jgi:SHAQKYF class myb-like DNA-binding protein